VYRTKIANNGLKGRRGFEKPGLMTLSSSHFSTFLRHKKEAAAATTTTTTTTR
jgi:hypothetical protein